MQAVRRSVGWARPPQLQQRSALSSALLRSTRTKAAPQPASWQADRTMAPGSPWVERHLQHAPVRPT